MPRRSPGSGSRRCGACSRPRTQPDRATGRPLLRHRATRASAAARARTARRLVEAVHGRVDAVAHDRLDGIGRLLDGHVDLGPLALAEPVQHVIGAAFLRHRLADADAHPLEVLGVQVGHDGPEPVVTGQAAARLHLQLGDRKVELVVDHDELLGIHAEPADEGADGVPRVVDVGERDRQRNAAPVDRDLVDERALLALPEASAVARREQLDDLGSKVVTRTSVLVARIAEPDDQQVGRCAPARPQPHGAQLSEDSSEEEASPPSPPSAAAAPSPSSPSGASPSTSSPSSPSSGSGSSTTRGITTCTTSSSASCCTEMPDGRGRSAMRNWSPMLSADTSASTPGGMSSGLASMLSVNTSCSRTPPSRTPSGSPTRWTGTSAATATSRRTRMKSTCSTSPRVGCRWICRARVRCSSPSTLTVMRVLAPDSPARMWVSSRLGTVRLVVSVSRPYITAGTLPSRRNRPAGRLPTIERGSAVSVLSALSALSAMRSGLVGARGPSIVRRRGLSGQVGCDRPRRRLSSGGGGGSRPWLARTRLALRLH